MIKHITAGIVALGVTASLAACGTTAVPTVTDPALQKQVEKAQVKVQNCAKKAGFVTKAQRADLLHCIAPKGKQSQVKKCVQDAVSDDLVRLRPHKAEFIQHAAECVVR